MPAEIPPELAANLDYYNSPDAVATFSFYSLLREEEYLFPKYFKTGDSVLDLACGLGRTTVLLHEMGMRVRGIDRSETFVNIAKRRFPYLDICVGSFDDIEEETASFSNVFIGLNSIDCAFPEEQRIAALRECARLLKPGGIFIFSSHNLKSLHWFSPNYGRGMGWKLRNSLRAFGNHSYIREDRQCLFYGAADYVIRQTTDIGLRLLEVRGFNRFRSSAIDLYFSPYIHYVFEKPLK